MIHESTGFRRARGTGGSTPAFERRYVPIEPGADTSGSLRSTSKLLEVVLRWGEWIALLVATVGTFGSGYAARRPGLVLAAILLLLLIAFWRIRHRTRRRQDDDSRWR